MEEELRMPFNRFPFTRVTVHNSIRQALDRFINDYDAILTAEDFEIVDRFLVFLETSVITSAEAIRISPDPNPVDWVVYSDFLLTIVKALRYVISSATPLN